MSQLNQHLHNVAAFHDRIGARRETAPALLSCDRAKCERAVARIPSLHDEIKALASDDELLCRLCLTLEETAEWLQAHADEDRVAAADAMGDRYYVLLGDAVSSGMPLSRIFDEVHQSNMSKAAQRQGELGKAQKSDGYRKPDLEFILANACPD